MTNTCAIMLPKPHMCQCIARGCLQDTKPFGEQNPRGGGQIHRKGYFDGSLQYDLFPICMSKIHSYVKNVFDSTYIQNDPFPVCMSKTHLYVQNSLIEYIQNDLYPLCMSKTYLCGKNSFACPKLI